mmetsp:Transcript_85150/g.241273  ORF Transcript_85150/g.241273 Transcript_85150/m.241273 type:complete len:202 (-) Transcript_85150:52-657(-)
MYEWSKTSASPARHSRTHSPTCSVQPGSIARPRCAVSRKFVLSLCGWIFVWGGILATQTSMGRTPESDAKRAFVSGKVSLATQRPRLTNTMERHSGASQLPVDHSSCRPRAARSSPSTVPALAARAAHQGYSATLWKGCSGASPPTCEVSSLRPLPGSWPSRNSRRAIIPMQGTRRATREPALGPNTCTTARLVSFSKALA